MPAFSANLLLKIAAAVALPLAAFATPDLRNDARPAIGEAAPAVVTLPPQEFFFRPAGDFSRNGAPADGPRAILRLKHPLSIMKTQVTAAMFDRCAREKACRPRVGGAPPRDDAPATGVSWEDATAYAGWLSRKTGDIWRLPTGEEWVFAAGSRFKDDAADGDDNSSFSQRWLAKYEQASERASEVDRAVRPIGGFGVNENGLLDVAGNVWEWTNACFTRQALDANGRPSGQAFVNCGVRLAEGRHRAFVSNFIRDARAGGCAVGAPPAHLGFRLVRDEGWSNGAWLPPALRAAFRNFFRSE